MCTLIALHRVIPDTPLVIASNRDEYYARPAGPPARVEARQPEGPGFVAPLDLEAGGTWMGLNSGGLFVGLTNRRTERREPSRRSRGLLVADALGLESARAVAEEMRTGLAGRYNPFHLLCADGRDAFLTVLREDGAETRELPPGVHVVGNRDASDPSSQKLSRLRAEVAALDFDAPLAVTLEGLRALLRGHPDPADPLENPCVHTPAYGTRSSSLIAVGSRPWCYWHAEGAPCQSKYENVSGLLDPLQ
jgi:uncharacterized protein with NRDE domain